ncbi:hypothetical protein J2S36_001166 [Arcanobacterium hippocoleae]|uniref:Uncharacterized protein n=1 Tax=Arcanobacterium hippocoleae TaxID=149017 RepID=A0ABU1T2M3_9ACTO|nr:hypothetical protein [Arcanobacterium hippocoleae]
MAVDTLCVLRAVIQFLLIFMPVQVRLEAGTSLYCSYLGDYCDFTALWCNYGQENRSVLEGALNT